MTAVPILNNHVLPFFQEHGVNVATVLRDNGRQCCGRQHQRSYKLFLQLDKIEHRRTKGQPQSNGHIARFHRTLLDEHPRVKGRTT